MSWTLAIAGFIVLIVLHEAGHFVAAKAVGMRVERFFLFFPPKVVSKKIGETEYGIGAIPLGGFVKITGMNPDELEPEPDPEHPPRQPGFLERVESVDQEEDAPDVSRPGEPLSPELRERAYYNQPVWKRIVVIGAGPAVNIVLAFIILFILHLNIEVPSQLRIDAIEKGSPAAGLLKPDDKLVSIDGQPADISDVNEIDAPLDRLDAAGATAERLSNQIDSHACPGQQVDGCASAEPVTMVVERDGKQETIQATPFYDAERGRHRLGFAYGAAGTQTAEQSPSEAAYVALDRIWFVTSQTVSVLARIFEKEQREQLSGVVGTSKVAQEAIESDARTAFLVLAVISLSLGIINLFPFLPLDGGHIFWSLVEKVRGRRVSFDTMEKASVFGFALVLMLFMIGLFNDIGRLSGDGFEIR